MADRRDEDRLPWPCTLWLVRHGQSAGNVARDEAELAGVERIALASRDADVPLSELGQRQSRALGVWFAQLPPKHRPNVVLHSPYVRAAETARIVVESAGLERDALAWMVDERLREKEFGILDTFTTHGIKAKFPELAAQRALVGKFYFRPPGGESWCDVILRLRSVLDTITRDYRGDRVLIVAHQVIVNCFRYLLEGLDERRILEIDRQQDVPNCAVTQFDYEPSVGLHGGMRLSIANFTAPLEEAATPVTVEPDRPAGPR